MDKTATFNAEEAELFSLLSQARQRHLSAVGQARQSHLSGVRPHTATAACSVSPAYQTMSYGNGGVSFQGEARWFEQIVAGQCQFNSPNDHVRQTGGSSFVEKWNKSGIDISNPKDGVDRGCQTIPFSSNFNGWQGGLPTARPNSSWLQQADQSAGNCGNPLDTYISGSITLIQQ